MADETVHDDGQDQTGWSKTRRRLILAGLGGAAAGALVRGNQPVAATEGTGNQGPLILGSNDLYRPYSPSTNTANVSSAATVLKASPNYTNYSAVAGSYVFRADASPAGGSINGLEGIASGGGAGVRGVSSTGFGVTATGSFGVYAQASGTGTGVLAQAIDGIGVQAISNGGVGGSFSGSRAAIRLVPNGGTGAPTTGTHSQGELWVDGSGDLYLCKTPGTPGTWVKVSEQSGGGGPVGPSLHILPTPDRFVDTRNNLGGVQGPVAAGTTSTYQMTGRNGQSGNASLQIPGTATALVGNLTVLGGASAPVGSYLTLWPQGAQPTTSSINFGPGAVVANSFTVGMAADGKINAFAAQQCDYIIDVVGYYG